MKEIWFIRHGQTDLNVANVYFGSTDAPLNETGLAQAQALHDRMPANSFHRSYASPLIRAYKTGQIVLPNENYTLTPALAERALGEWEGLAVVEIKERYSNMWQEWKRDWLSFEPPGGESFEAFWKRVTGFMQEIVERPNPEGVDTEKILFVSHSGPIRVLLAHSLGMPKDAVWRFSVENACLSCLKMNDEGYAWLSAHNA